MSRTLTISDELYGHLEAEARGLPSVERLLEAWELTEPDLSQRESVVCGIDQIRERLLAKYGEMNDSTESLCEDRAR